MIFVKEYYSKFNFNLKLLFYRENYLKRLLVIFNYLKFSWFIISIATFIVNYEFIVIIFNWKFAIYYPYSYYVPPIINYFW